VIDVSLATGFEPASHFSRSYGRHLGVAPSQDRIGAAPAVEIAPRALRRLTPPAAAQAACGV
jgi:AraC-like DNA-binding protein